MGGQGVVLSAQAEGTKLMVKLKEYMLMMNRKLRS